MNHKFKPKINAFVSLSLALLASCPAFADAYNPDTDWMVGKVGIFQHYLFNRTPVEQVILCSYELKPLCGLSATK